MVPRTIAYIPASELDETLLLALEPGDYVGIFSQRPGLDVSHTGLIVKAGATVKLRHASSRDGVQRVVDVVQKPKVQRRLEQGPGALCAPDKARMGSRMS